MKKINRVLNDFKVFGLSVGNLAMIATLVVTTMTIFSKIGAAQDAKIKAHNDAWMGVHPYLQAEIDTLRCTQAKLFDAVKSIEKGQDSSTDLIVSEIRKLYDR